MSPHPLNNVELITWLLHQQKIESILAGVYCRDTLPQIQHYRPTLYIVNTAGKAHPTGIHWICLLVGIPISEYFDSLGQPPSADFIQFLGPNYTYCTVKLQVQSPVACGYYCLLYALCRAHDVSFESIIINMYKSDDYAIMQTVEQITPLL